jgi:hypothetical protein
MNMSLELVFITPQLRYAAMLIDTLLFSGTAYFIIPLAINWRSTASGSRRLTDEMAAGHRSRR